MNRFVVLPFLLVTTSSFAGDQKWQLIWSDEFNGSFTFIPAAGFSGIVQIRYMVEDPLGLKDEAVITITVNPTAKDDINTTFINQPVAGNVLTNDQFENNATLTVTAETKTTDHGSVTINADGT